MQWCDRELTAFGMSHRTAPPEPLFYVGTGAQPSTVFKRQPGLQPAIDPELYSPVEISQNKIPVGVLG